MKSMLFAATVTLAAVSGLSPVLAADAGWYGNNPRQTVPGVSSGRAARAPHYEWRYGYFGHHPEYRGHWVPVR